MYTRGGQIVSNKDGLITEVLCDWDDLMLTPSPVIKDFLFQCYTSRVSVKRGFQCSV